MRNFTHISNLILLTLLLCSCGDQRTRLFSRVDAEASGIDFENTLFEGGSFNILNYAYYYNGGGVAIGDINNDGLQDVLFTGNMVKNRLYINRGNFEFEDITDRSGVAREQGWCTGATMADVNHDGKLDIYISRSADVNPQRRKNLLFINNGDLTFTEKAEAFGLAEPGYSTQSAFFDYDKDGDLDCFIINHSLQLFSGGTKIDASLRDKRNANFACKLYRNDYDQYVDVSADAGITSNVLTAGLGLAVSDVDNDGWPDVYVSNDFNEPDYLFMNNGDGTFTESLAARVDQVSLFSMGSDVSDFNNDGMTDIFSLDMLPEGNQRQKMHAGPENYNKFQDLFGQGFYYQYSRNMLQKNNGDGTFSEIGQLAGVSNTDWSWAALFADFDNDGHKDLFVTNGYVRDYTDMDFVMYSVNGILAERQGGEGKALNDYIAKMPASPLPNYIFENNGSGSFTNRAEEWGLGETTLSTGAAYADLDNDGDLDLVVNNINSAAGVYRNNSEVVSENNYVSVRLAGEEKNASGIGAKVTLYCGEDEYFQEAFVSRGFQSSVDPVLNFGTGTHTVVDSLVIVWPDDRMQRFYDVGVNQVFVARQSTANETVPSSDGTARSTPVFSTVALSAATHAENVHNDFSVQSLLPNFLSRQGPQLAVADVNNDGRDDFYVGGPKGEAGKLYTQDSEGEFAEKPQRAFAADAGSEDAAAEFFDADGDGDPDLYVGSGGYAFQEDDAALQDRLYINDGRGNFSKKAAALPAMLISTGCVKTSDIDRDGDLDIFVGGRVVPGRYPLAAESKILQNNGSGTFADITAAFAPMLQDLGMVTDAAWLDVNEDALPDLVVVGEWMPVKVFVNANGKLMDASASYIKFASTGWWNRLYTQDMDGDGDRDLVIGNGGLNNQFHCSEQEPLRLYYKDFDSNGSVDPIMCYYIDGTEYPSASRDDLIAQLPMLKKSLLTYSDYANATIHDLFSAEQLRDAVVLKAETMETIYLENKLAAGFQLHPLPREVQYAPVYAITSLDANNDSKRDLLLMGNNTWTRIKYGRHSASHGMLLTGNGANEFAYVPQYASGLHIRGNVRSLRAVKRRGGNDVILAGVNDSPVMQLSWKAVPDARTMNLLVRGDTSVDRKTK